MLLEGGAGGGVAPVAPRQDLSRTLDSATIPERQAE
jgi:hypothetical protein